MKKKILIFSAGAAGREVFQLILSINKLQNEWEVIGYVDDDVNKVGNTIDNTKVYSAKNKPKKNEIYATCGVMDNAIRKKIFNEERIKSGYQITNLINITVILKHIKGLFFKLQILFNLVLKK